MIESPIYYKRILEAIEMDDEDDHPGMVKMAKASRVQVPFWVKSFRVHDANGWWDSLLPQTFDIKILEGTRNDIGRSIGSVQSTGVLVYWFIGSDGRVGGSSIQFPMRRKIHDVNLDGGITIGSITEIVHNDLGIKIDDSVSLYRLRGGLTLEVTGGNLTKAINDVLGPWAEVFGLMMKDNSLIPRAVEILNQG